MATSVGGVLTGRGGDVIIIDDPLKPDDALSETRRKAVNDWYDNTLLSRLNDKTNGCIIIIMQRLHQDDLVGHVLEQDQWDVLTLPATAKQDECHTIHSCFGMRRFVRREGEALHPEREPIEMIQKIRERMGTYNFSSQYQQAPQPLEGNIIKSNWLKYYETGECPATFSSKIQSWDTANKAGELNDYSVCTTWGKSGKHYYLLNVFRKRMEYPGLKRAVKEQYDLHKPGTILIEDKASGTQLIQDLRADGIYDVKAFDPVEKDKTMRLNAQSATFESGQVFLPKEAHWLAAYVDELTSFPGGKHHDQVDSTTQALEHMKSGPRGFFDIDVPAPTWSPSPQRSPGVRSSDFSTHRIMPY
jgi:predicted phage terminase large subunit-like protein